MKVGLFDHMQKHDNPARSYVDLYQAIIWKLWSSPIRPAWIFTLSPNITSTWAFPNVRVRAVFSARRRSGLKIFAWAHSSTCCPCGIRCASPKKSALLDNLTERPLGMRHRRRHRSVFASPPTTFLGSKARDDTRSAANHQRHLDPRNLQLRRQVFSSAKTSTRSIPLVQKPHPPLWMPTRSKDSIEEAAIHRHQHGSMGAVRHESDAQSLRRIPRRLPTRQTGRPQTAYGPDARDLCRRERQASPRRWRVSLEELLGAARRRAHLRRPRIHRFDDDSRRQPAPRADGHGTLHRRRLVYLRRAGNRRAANQENRQPTPARDTFLGEFTFGELTQKQALNSLRLFTEQVMPELRKFEVDALNFPKAEA